jgi:hypothetical protein
VCLIGVCMSGCNKGAVVAFMIVATLFYGSMFAGVFSNHVDIASNYAGNEHRSFRALLPDWANFCLLGDSLLLDLAIFWAIFFTISSGSPSLGAMFFNYFPKNLGNFYNTN